MSEIEFGVQGIMTMLGAAGVSKLRLQASFSHNQRLLSSIGIRFCQYGTLLLLKIMRAMANSDQSAQNSKGIQTLLDVRPAIQIVHVALLTYSRPREKHRRLSRKVCFENVSKRIA